MRLLSSDKKLIYFISLSIGLMLSFCYYRMYIDPKDPRIIYREQMVFLKTNTAWLDITLPKDTYMMRLKHVMYDNQHKTVKVNGQEKVPDLVPYYAKRGLIETSYMQLERSLIQEGKNKIEVVFQQRRPGDVDIRISNYRLKVQNDIFVVFKDSIFNRERKVPFWHILLIMSLSLVFFAVVKRIVAHYPQISLRKMVLIEFWFICPFLVILLVLANIVHLGVGYTVLLNTRYFMLIVLFMLLFTQVAVLLAVIFKPRLFSKTQDDSQADQVQAPRNWFVKLSFSQKCAFWAIINIVVGSLFTILHFSFIADVFGSLAYIMLAVSIINNISKILKDQRR